MNCQDTLECFRYNPVLLEPNNIIDIHYYIILFLCNPTFYNMVFEIKNENFCLQLIQRLFCLEDFQILTEQLQAYHSKSSSQNIDPKFLLVDKIIYPKSIDIVWQLIQKQLIEPFYDKS